MGLTSQAAPKDRVANSPEKAQLPNLLLVISHIPPKERILFCETQIDLRY